MRPHLSLVLFAAALAGWANAQESPMKLLDIGPGLDVARIPVSDARLTLKGKALRMDTGTKDPWPGMTVAAPGGKWDLTRRTQISVRVRNVGKRAVNVYLRVDNPGADGVKNCITQSVAVDPGKTERLAVVLPRPRWNAGAAELFGMRGSPVGGAIQPSQINQLILFTIQDGEGRSFELSDVQAEGKAPPPAPAPSGEFLPFIDGFGQFRHEEWPGKTRDAADLAARAKAEEAELAAKPGPGGWDRFGGWLGGPKLEATGFFRTTKHQGKWWLVDPDGRLFWSNGIDCVGMLDATPVEERESYFADFPGKQPEFGEFLNRGFTLHGHYAGKSPMSFSFAGANLLRKYGDDWKARRNENAQRRLRSWGLNTIGNWSDADLYRLRKTPYVATLGVWGTPAIAGSEGYWGKFPDPFAPEFEKVARANFEAEKGKSAGDPWCIGYFVDNELSWGDEWSLALASLTSPADQPAKVAFVADLKAKYGEVAKLNAAWGTTYTSWEAVAETRTVPDRDKASADLKEFSRRVAERYFQTIRDALRAVAPNQLYLGCRFAWANPVAVGAATKFCDVVSFNLYQRSVAGFRMSVDADVPLIIGEFHFGALDRGLFHTGLVPVADQAARAQAYADYVRGALRHPQFVGCHWFQWQDEPTTGRVYDEENYQIGFVDIADTPYPETVAASREVGYRLYELRNQP